MSVIRAFIAVNLTTEVQQTLDDVIAMFGKKLEGAPVRWVPGKNIHLTLKFLGDVSISNLDLLKKILQAEVATHRPFEISIGGTGAFPNVRRPRVIWVGVQAPPELMTMQYGIENALAKVGYLPEERPFSPHLTLGRIPKNTNAQGLHVISNTLETTKVGFLGAFCVNEVRLYKSDLQPSGANYTSIFTAPLSKLN
jgi:2'-5' RNA ligase